LQEVLAVRQVAGEGRRRWFTSEVADLFVWYDGKGDLAGFQFCYDKPMAEHALTWRKDSGFTHQRVDPGDWTGGMKGTSVLAASSRWAATTLLARFRRVSDALPEDVRQLVDTTVASAVRRPRSMRGPKPPPD
jgi:hypothetical protein